MDRITLNRPVDVSEGSLAFLQLRYALPMYGWVTSRRGSFFLYPLKKKCIKAVFSLETIYLSAFLCITLLFDIHIVADLLGAAVALSFLIFRIRRTLKVYRSLPKFPIATINRRKHRIVFRRCIPCVQIAAPKLVLDLDDIKSAEWKSSRCLNNRGDLIRVVPVMEFDLSYKGFYLRYSKDGEEKEELLFCGQKVDYRTCDEIVKKCRMNE